MRSERRGPYMTQKRRDWLRQIEQEAAEQRKQKHRVHARRSAAKVRAARKAAGIPSPKHKPEKPGSSTTRWRKWEDRRRVAAAAAAAQAQAAHVAQLAAKREAEGKERARTNAEHQAAWREREKIKRAALLAGQWFSPALTIDEIEAILKEQFPNLDGLRRYTSQAHLMACADREKLNVNRYLIATDGVDGLALAVEKRAIFSEAFEAMQKAAGKPPDLIECLRAAEAIPCLIGDVNARRRAQDFARSVWGAGSEIYEALVAATRP